MKQFLAAVLVAVLVIPSPVLAHGGRTDASGGHTDRSTGEYHYHHGYSAHQHPNGVCPYNFDDQTDHGSGTTSSNPSNSGSSSWVYVDSHFFEGFRYNETTDEWLRDDGEYYESSSELFDCYGFYYDYGCDVWYNEDGFIDEDFCVRNHADGDLFYCDSCQTLMHSFEDEKPEAHDDYCSYIEELEESREEAMAFMDDSDDHSYDDRGIIHTIKSQFKDSDDVFDVVFAIICIPFHLLSWLLNTAFELIGGYLFFLLLMLVIYAPFFIVKKLGHTISEWFRKRKK